ncbi:MAG: CaiB/BaiF CoA transferase family protein [Acidimicrobiales bacterium]
MAGPLSDVRILELAGLGALPYGSLRLADMGADVIRIDRVAEVPAPADRTAKPYSSWDRGRRSIAVDLKSPAGVETVLRLVDEADVFLEAFRPGVTERLGLGPEEVLGRKPDIVYGRLTGWGQTGRLAPTAGHSLNYEAITGVIDAIGPKDGAPVPLLQILGDFAGGGLTLAYGVMCALWEAKRSGEGQVVDVAMTDGVASIASTFFGMAASGFHRPERGTNLFDGGAPFYAIYECADGKYLSVAPIEGHFYARFLEHLGLADADLPAQYDRERWPELRERIASVLATRTRDEWAAVFETTDCCVAPVLTFDEARVYGHHLDRGTFVDDTELAVIPRLSRTPGELTGRSPSWAGADTDEVLLAAGWSTDEIASLRADGVIDG